MPREDSELERYAKIIGETEINKELLRQKRLLPCAYDGSDCLFSYWAENTRYQGYPVIVAFCMRARQIRRGFFDSISNIEGRLKRTGCPEWRHNLFFGWKCKYADGKIHEL